MAGEDARPPSELAAASMSVGLPTARRGILMPDEARIAALPRRTLVMNDGAELSIIDAGSGPPLIILPSWTNSAAQYHHQVTAFAADRRVLAVDVRAAGLSAKVDYGLRVSRFSPISARSAISSASTGSSSWAIRWAAPSSGAISICSDLTGSMR